jgi:HNH endonuclease
MSMFKHPEREVLNLLVDGKCVERFVVTKASWENFLVRVDQFSTSEEFWKRVKKTDTCWIWNGAVNADGYGRYKFFDASTGKRRDIAAHRFVYQSLRDVIPSDMELHHQCHNRRCVNPSHLEPLTGIEHGDKHCKYSPEDNNLTEGIEELSFMDTKKYLDKVPVR